MKKFSYVIMIVLAGYALQGCNSPKGDNSNADSTAKMNDTAKTPAVADSMKDNAKFVHDAAIGGMAEVALGKLAQQKSTNADIKKFAAMMVKDHNKNNGELMAIAKAQNIGIPPAVDDDSQKKMDDLGNKSGNDFDKSYADNQIDGHEKMLSLMQDAAKNSKNPQLKAFAEKTVPAVQMHLDAIKKIKKDMK